ncbi:(d)CMP kinase [Acidiluteibacter ferrifornacis]|uniref:Cytidylate kinase n=1 Tax=Acidiluteibacter ferrifornacis TaxID=2692424 RepID=A0A6N9NG67_9FLAO|nr:(d)CMP kinase [Acidiluteibacter ferrifornacis]NBG65626.1 (d)CMP kinase [Acidiluteibacter ferrifornacis]
MSKIVIAIDGFSSCGKSTLAKNLAKKLSYAFIDTGAMYRAVTLYFLRKGITDFKGLSRQRVIDLLKEINIDFRFNESKQFSDTYLNGENVEDEIRSTAVNNAVSALSQVSEVRAQMVALQQQLGAKKGVVLDGRDVGTVVFPDAELKLFMTADPVVRAQRRFDELQSKGVEISLEEVKTNLEQRDYNDTHRKEHPLVKADDAIILDNTNINREEQLQLALDLALERIG